jgi:translation initiation factor 2 subunit 3
MRGQVVGAKDSLPEPTTRIQIEVHPFKRLIGLQDTELKTNEVVVLTIGTLTTVGTIEGKKNGLLGVNLRGPVIVEENQRIAISKKAPNGWRLVAYGVCRGS